jgi:hypothetical protein
MSPPPPVCKHHSTARGAEKNIFFPWKFDPFWPDLEINPAEKEHNKFQGSADKSSNQLFFTQIRICTLVFFIVSFGIDNHRPKTGLAKKISRLRRKNGNNFISNQSAILHSLTRPFPVQFR